MKFPVIIIFSLLVHIVQAQTYSDIQILYNFSIQADSANENSRKEWLCELLIAEQISVFHKMSKYDSDSVLNESKLTKGIAYSYGPINQTNFEIVKSEDTIKTFEFLRGTLMSISNDLSIYSERRDSMIWEISSDTSTIAGFLCQKATTTWGGRKWIAWFNTEISISDGPYKFQGLPGLIIAVNDEDEYFQFKFAGMLKKKKIIFDVLSLREDLKIHNTTKSNFLKKRQEIRNNLILIAKAEGTHLSDKNIEYMKEAQLKDNNFIELF